MTNPILAELVEKARVAAGSEDPSRALRIVLQDSLAQSEQMADAIGVSEEDEVMLFEDETCSIWTCRYGSEMVLAPHEHKMPVHIAVYRATEVEVLYKQEPGTLRHVGNKLIRTGEIARLGPDAIHAITSDGAGQSHAVHIYEGPLTQVERSLFDWDTGAEVEFTMENFHAMARQKSDMDEFAT